MGYRLDGRDSISSSGKIVNGVQTAFRLCRASYPMAAGYFSPGEKWQWSEAD
jgi:hypothetical protein